MAMITNALMESMAAQTTGKQEQKASQSGDFGKTFNEYTSKAKETASSKNVEAKKPDVNKNDKTRDSKKGNNYDKSQENVNNNDNAKKPSDDKVNNQKTETVSADKKTESTKPTSEVENLSKEEKQALDQSIIASLAQSLNISTEVVETILVDLEMTATDLMDSGNLNAFMQKVLDVETPIDMLNIPNVDELFKDTSEAITETFENFMATPVKTEAKEVRAEVTEGEVAEVAPKIQEQEVLAKPAVAEEVTDEAVKVIETKTTETVNSTSNKGTNSDMMNFSEGNQQQSEVVDSANTVNTGIGTISDFKTAAAVQIKNESVKNINQQDVINQIIEEIKVDIKSADVSEIKMILKPESLGEISLKIATQNGVVTAQFIAENERVKEIIESNFNQLKEALTEQGINISELSVSISQGDKERQMQEFLQGRSKSQGRINSIINGITAEEELALASEVDSKSVYQNNVDYVI